jgi:hypothetical protein
MRTLVIASEPITVEDLRRTLGESATEAEVLVIAPALTDSPIRFWLSDVDAAITKALHVMHDSVRRLGSAGVRVAGDIGEADPREAIRDALRTFDADRVVVFRHAEDELAYREEELVSEVIDELDVPVETGIVERAPR